MPSLRCLISALTQAGGGDLLFRFPSSVQSCCGEGGGCRQTPLCVGSTPRVPATLGLPHTGVSAFPVYPAQAFGCSIWSGPCIECSSSFRVLHKSAEVAPACCVYSGLSGPGSPRLGRPLPGAVRLFPPRPPRAPPVGSQEVFRQDPGPVCRMGGGGFSGAEFPLAPPPCLLPPAGMGRLFSGISQSLCFANSRRCVLAG